MNYRAVAVSLILVFEIEKASQRQLIAKEDDNSLDCSTACFIGGYAAGLVAGLVPQSNAICWAIASGSLAGAAATGAITVATELPIFQHEQISEFASVTAGISSGMATGLTIKQLFCQCCRSHHRKDTPEPQETPKQLEDYTTINIQSDDKRDTMVHRLAHSNV